MTLPSSHRIRILTPVVSAHYFSVTEVPLNDEFRWMSVEETFCFFETIMSERGLNSRFPFFQAGSFNHCTRAPQTVCRRQKCIVSVNWHTIRFHLITILQMLKFWLEVVDRGSETQHQVKKKLNGVLGLKVAHDPVFVMFVKNSKLGPFYIFIVNILLLILFN